MANNPVLRQSVRWGEEYVSRGLNIKFAGVIPPGIYRGFHLAPYNQGALLVEHGPDCQQSVAVVERDGYSLSVIMDDGGSVEIPAPGEWWICLEAFYAPTQPGYQRIVARERLEPHHVVLGKAILDDEGLRFSEEDRQDAEILTRLDIQEIRNQFALDVSKALELADEAVIRAIDDLDCKSEEIIGILHDKLAGTVEEAKLVQTETKRLLEEAQAASSMQTGIALCVHIMRNANRLMRLELLHNNIEVPALAPVPPPNLPDVPDDSDPPDLSEPDLPSPDDPSVDPDIPDAPDNPGTSELPDSPENPEKPVCNCCCCRNKP